MQTLWFENYSFIRVATGHQWKTSSVDFGVSFVITMSNMLNLSRVACYVKHHNAHVLSLL